MPSFAVVMFVFLCFGGLLCAVRGDSVSSQFTMTDAQIETTAASIFHVSVSGPVPVSRLATVCYRVYTCCPSFCDIPALIAVMSQPDSSHVGLPGFQSRQSMLQRLPHNLKLRLWLTSPFEPCWCLYNISGNTDEGMFGAVTHGQCAGKERKKQISGSGTRLR